VKFRIMNRVVNPFVRALLRSPLHGLLSGSLAVLTYTGKRSGRRRSLPVMYAEDRGALIVFAGRPREKRWWRNLRGGAPVEIVLRGRRLQARAEVVSEDGASAADAVAVYAAKFPRSGTHLHAGEEAVLVRITLAEGGDDNA
jgi:deazaflavin-dependent oxidoreductase (nitroreductase family)